MTDQDKLIITGLFNAIVAQSPQSVSLEFKKGDSWMSLTYQELKRQALKVAAFLKQEGFKKGSFAVLLLENRPEWIEIYLGIIYAGLASIPLDHQLSSQEIKNFLLDSNAKILFCSQEIFACRINQEIGQLLEKTVVVDLEHSGRANTINFNEIEKIIPREEPLVLVEPEDIASLIYTSGTTGQPKGVLLTHKNIASNFMGIYQMNMCRPLDNFLSFLPLHHTYPFMVTFIVPLFYGAKITFMPAGFRPGDLLKILKEKKITILVGVPQLFSLIHNAIQEKIKKIPYLLRLLLWPFIRIKIRENLGKDLRLLVSGGARLEPNVGRALRSLGLRIIEGYGLTETSPVVTFNPLQKVKFGSVGKPLPDVEIKILNPDKQGVGQVLIKGPNVMKGYFQQPELSASVIKEGWFHSGDLGYIDKEGYLFITGREKEVIILSSGKTIYPEELEDYYRASLYIKEICILQKAQEQFGHLAESLFAVVLPDLEYFRSKQEANIQAKIRWELENLSKGLPPYKHIMGFVVTKEELPKTALKKIQRYKVRDKYSGTVASALEPEETYCAEDAKILEQDIAQKIIHYLSSQLKKPVSLNSHLEIDLGIDSLARVELGLGLESLLSIKIPDEVLYTVSTVREVILKILQLAQSKDGLSLKETPKNWAEILREEPSLEIMRKIQLQATFLDYLITWIFKSLILFIFRIFWLLKITAKINLPLEGPYLICPNHASYLDGFTVFVSIPFRVALNTYFLGYSAIFEHPLISWAVKTARFIPIDPNLHLVEAMQAVAYVLAHKKIVCIFPEGRRSIDENIGEFRKGIGILMKELGIPVVPAYIKGSHQSWPRGSRLPQFYPLKINFGHPYKSSGDDYETVAKELRDKVIGLTC